MKRATNATYVDPVTGPAPDRTDAHLAFMDRHRDQAAFVDLYTVTLATLGVPDLSTGKLASPMTLRWADALYDVVFEGQFYAGGGVGGLVRPDRMVGPRLVRKGLSAKAGTEVVELEIDIALDGTDQLPPADGDPATPRFGLGEAILGGLFDGARVELRRLVLPGHPTYPLWAQSLADRGDLGPGDLSLGAVHMFLGRVTGDSEVSRSHAVLRVKSIPEALGLQMPWRIYQPGCLWTLYDKGCGLSRTGSFAGQSFQFIGTIDMALDETRLRLPFPGPPQPTGFFDFGTVTFTSGVLSGFTATISKWTNGAIFGNELELLLRLPRLPAPGDGVCLQAGCDKVGYVIDPADGTVVDGTCQVKFGNGLRFSGQAHVPIPTTAY